ncbi:MAG: envelope stress response membrane protein PspB [Allosphingosinicella sp.]
MGNLIGLVAVLSAIIGLPWLIFHYITRWKTAATLTNADEKLMEELYDLAGRLDERMCSIERIMTAENPNWRQIACDPAATGIEERAFASPGPRRIGQ